MRRTIIAASVLCSIAYLGSTVTESAPAATAVTLKVGSILLLLALAAASVRRSVPLLAALAASALGDFLLGVPRLGPLGEGELFVFGLGAFLLAHSWYIALFGRNLAEGVSRERKAGIAVAILTLAITLFVLWPSLGDLRIAVLVYAIALDAMAVTALASRFPPLVGIGALFFVASDAMLALEHFGHPFAAARVLVWTTYYAAQFMITVGVLRRVSADRKSKSLAA